MKIQLVDFDGSFTKLERGDILKIESLDVVRAEFPDSLTTICSFYKGREKYFAALLSYQDGGIGEKLSRIPNNFYGEQLDRLPSFACATYEINFNDSENFAVLNGGAKGHFGLQVPLK